MELTAADCIANAEERINSDTQRAQIYALIAIAKSLNKLERPIEVNVTRPMPTIEDIQKMFNDQIDAEQEQRR